MHQRPEDARALFQRFAKIDGLEARFTEENHLALLALLERIASRT